MKKLLDFSEELTPGNPAYLEQLYERTFTEILRDINPNGDISTICLYGEMNQTAQAVLIAKEDMIISGMEEFYWFLKACCLTKEKSLLAPVNIEAMRKDGEKLQKGEIIAQIKAPIQYLLKIERTVLNLIQRMSGIATQTSNLAQKARPATLAGTRKTQWGLLDKKAIAIGGGSTHRLNASQAIMIKDTHIDPLGRDSLEKSIKKVLDCAKRNTGKVEFIDIEVTSKIEAMKVAKILQEAKLGIPKVIMLDNFSVKEVRKTIEELVNKKIRKNIVIEASGGINEKTIFDYGQTGVDLISMGILTHSVKASDISMKIHSN